jgi:undecaprenyl-diphosphatase
VSFGFLTFLILNYLTLVILFTSLLWIWRTGGKSIVLWTLFTSSLAWFIGQSIKIFFYFPRPFILSGQLPQFATPLDATFPSLHAATAFAVALTVARFRPRMGIILILLAMLVSFARYYYHLHTPVDLLAGFCVAVISVVVIDTCHS